MSHFFHHALEPWIIHYGSLTVAILVMLESFGLPLPGETALVSAAMYAGTTHRIDIYVLIASAALGATLGGAIGYWFGRKAGYPILRKHGSRIGLTERRMLAGQYLFSRHGGKIIIFGRFFAILRALAAILAGVTMMEWRRFLVCQTLASIVWALCYGGLAYIFGKQLEHIGGPLGIIAGIVVAACIIAVIYLTHRHGDRFERIAAARAKGKRI